MEQVGKTFRLWLERKLSSTDIAKQRPSKCCSVVKHVQLVLIQWLIIELFEESPWVNRLRGCGFLASQWAES